MTFSATNRLPLGFVHRLTIAVSVAIVLAACVWALSANASDVQVKVPVRLAAVGDGMPAPSRRLQSTIDVLQLVQTLAPANPGEQTHEELIIVAVDASNPENLDEEIAQAHKLELVKRLVMSAIGLRVISYRIVDAQTPGEILERLRADSRITSAQVNVAYRPLPLFEPNRLTSVPPKQHPVSGDPTKRQKPVEPRSSSKAASANAAPKQVTAKIGGAAPMRVAADVLAGGL